ncbi:MAG: NAD(P)/FAD-dependent oxidoreductase [Bacteroidetes bacterium]|nr:MAG: NAD(P)/FAD-dependent oxidoreductase [Bacteroidota bacterium]
MVNMKVVIVGGGFGGLKLARSLNNKKGFEVILIDKVNYHQFQPLLYQVATAGLDASNISFPLRKVFHKSKNVRIRLAEVKEIVPSQNKVITSAEEIDYDILVLATGTETNFFGNQQLVDYAFPMKSTVDALQIRHKLIRNFEEALLVKDAAELQRLMNIVVVGGGPTGVELSGALAEMKHYVLPKDYPELDFSKMNIYLLEGGSKTLGNMSEKSAADSYRYLTRLGVKVLTNTIVNNFDGDNVQLKDGNTIPSKTVIWAAGVTGSIPPGFDKSLIARGNRLIVDRYLRLKGFENIYVIGDLAYMETPKYPQSHPQLASAAIQQGKLLAENLKKLQANDREFTEFEYRDKGTLATVGRNLAVADFPKPKLHFGGFIAWIIWMSLHLVLILGVKNRFFVFSNWVYNYFTYDQSLRLIFPEFYKTKKGEPSNLVLDKK